MLKSSNAANDINAQIKILYPISLFVYRRGLVQLTGGQTNPPNFSFLNQL